MKKILIQLDTDPRPSAFDAMVAHDAGVDALLSYGDVTPDVVQGLVQGAFFTRAPENLSNLAVWVGGASMPAGEEVLEAVKASFFGPFKVSAMLDSNGGNTTAAAMVARIAGAVELSGKRAVIVGVGPVGVRAGALFEQEGCDVLAVTIPADVLGTDSYRRPRGFAVAQKMGLEVVEVSDRAEMESKLDGAQIVVASGPAGVEVLKRETWSANDSIELLADANAAEPLGLEGVEAMDDLEERDGKLVLGALAIGGPKMKLHKGCVRRLFETNEEILDYERIYALAGEQG